ncbi:Methylthioadenosine phosphorylase [Ceraceosorus guamensis]|uniref:S-methyl-5'-thioadenosine phosphorylase n=1 Tax=Ceraceosorus guamensis TaxID=1522189 RepID=A0A316WDZ6_9BASI|nr:Methylthioadenosine phosphorylase [Ceraceosorus guamensis]PWN46023.1 Methylthioadenosine phosphorylase [Ceraceosorus guamensis]
MSTPSGQAAANAANKAVAPSPAQLKEWNIRVGIIGGSGIYKLEGFQLVATVNPQTPWGYPSSPITISKNASGTHVAFLARHGLTHSFTPSTVPVPANIASLKSLGVKAILAFSAVGSLREEIAPKDFVVPSQIIDRTKGIRRGSFFGEGEDKGVVAHAMFGDPFCETLRPLVEKIARETLAKVAPNVKVHGNKTAVCMEGPQFSTRAESLMYRAWGGDIINMSALPEAKLAREAELAYALIATATDYDAWRPSEESVGVAEVIACLVANVQASQKVTAALVDPIHALVKDDESELVKKHEGTMRDSIMTRSEAIPESVKPRIRYILPWFAA